MARACCIRLRSEGVAMAAITAVPTLLLMVRAMVFALGLGIALLRSSAALEPLTSASSDDLILPPTEAYSAL